MYVSTVERAFLGKGRVKLVCCYINKEGLEKQLLRNAVSTRYSGEPIYFEEINGRPVAGMAMDTTKSSGKTSYSEAISTFVPPKP